MRREYYSDTITRFLERSQTEILGELVANNDLGPTLERSQRDAWLEQIRILKSVLERRPWAGKLYFEYSIPRLGGRIDVVALIGPVVFVLEFKVYEETFKSSAVDQVWDYALDLKNFHESTHHSIVVPVLIPTAALRAIAYSPTTWQNGGVPLPIRATPESLGDVFEQVLKLARGPAIEPSEWESGRYCPTPTIVEAATALYRGHSVSEISRSDAAAINLSHTSETISDVIRSSREHGRKSICFVTGVPGAGKTLVGLNIATKHIEKTSELYSVFISGNGPLVNVLREALTRDKLRHDCRSGTRVTKGSVASEVKMFIQNIHHFRDDCLKDESRPPIEHVALFDEAQRAWNLQQTSNFMRRRRGRGDFNQSEPEFLISCLDRHRDWAVVVCLVGGGQEINTGEAGISEWIDSLDRSFPNWNIHVSSRLSDSEYGAAGEVFRKLNGRPHVTFHDQLHLSVSLRSYRAENVSLLVKQLLDLETHQARQTIQQILGRYPIAMTRQLSRAKEWLRTHASGTERYGLVASSKAERLKPHAIHVKAPLDPVHWFLEGKEDVRSSYYLEDAATEFAVQGLELDWACVTWDADFRFRNGAWQHWFFRGNRWQRVNSELGRSYLKNAYRVLLTRARQGMVIFVPEGDNTDVTRKPEYYDATFEYLREIGLEVL